MTGLLRSIKDRGYPADYLLARVRGRRARLISNWLHDGLITDPLAYITSSAYRGFLTEKSVEGIWRSLTNEYQWIYSRMNRESRRIISPFILYTELRTIFICLRHIRRRGPGRAGVLSGSLLSEGLKNGLLAAHDISDAAAKIEKAFLTLSDSFSGLSDLCAGEDLSTFEQALTSRYLVAMTGRPLHPLMKTFFLRIIDSRNIIALLKFLTLRPGTAPAWLPSGNISAREFTAIVRKKEMSGLLRLAGIKEDGPGPLHIEPALYRSMTLFIKKAGRDPLGIGPVFDYLWRSSIEVMNLSTLLYAHGMDRDIIERELVY
ncbi:MAG: hypothetical protein C0402_04555 [Thermodesulfovibrio sp.]|nr:hypothetical protein [Thermodesulfovibrio sp.]